MAPIAMATWFATMSALMLKTLPASSAPRHASTGTKPPLARRSRSRSVHAGDVAERGFEVDRVGARRRSRRARRPPGGAYGEAARAVKADGRGPCRDERRAQRSTFTLPATVIFITSERLGVGDLATCHDARRLAEPLLELRRLGTTAVGDHDALSAPLHGGHVLGDRLERYGPATTSPPSFKETTVAPFTASRPDPRASLAHPDRASGSSTGSPGLPRP